MCILDRIICEQSLKVIMNTLLIDDLSTCNSRTINSNYTQCSYSGPPNNGHNTN